MNRRAALVPLRYVTLPGHGPEDVVADRDGSVLTGVADGRILRISGLDDPAHARVEHVGEIGGRPLGLELLPDGALLVCDAEGALLRLDTADGSVRVLTESAPDGPLRFCSNVVALPDGSVCFTVSSREFALGEWIGDLVGHTGTGRLLRLAPGAGVPEVLLEGLQFANGLAVSGCGTFLIVAETGARRLTRYWLTGPRAGHAEPFAQNLPGYPDNLWRDGAEGPVWVALAGPRVPPLDLLHRTSPALRRRAARLALHAPYRPSGTAAVLAVDDTGRTVHHLTHRHSRFRMVTSVCRTKAGLLVLGSLAEPGIAVCAPL
ncbi:SMP-30/gluconolactonase/LRE family protein [Streptomyces roseirectus]|uniref:SMP-30/gluconolactonase/LRE family protein n=1 Tax=Streptomyces roseirectus TaxID=2768066 RepID=A0A7H0I7M2_9ACTN|nr:SMP-30/gluconolactonase/LRE family protein [Streptomyces roseirectus]QNP68788.1 SMP-30/gluconolactonase/LRE family protein [Streptomyces roseirectus]